MDSPEAMSPAPDQPQPLRSVHTSNLPEIFNQLGISVLVSTYQSGHLVMLRPDGDVLNTHFRIFDKPMGMAVDSNRLAIGTAMEVIEFHNLPSVAARLDPPNVNDSVFLPRVSNWTGDIQIHEMAWVNSTAENGNEKAGSPDELVFINTLFSCLCCRSDTFSFEPIWRPSFITKYVPGDCCHVNGLATQDGVIKYVTALGETDAPGGWRENKKDGGLLVDVEANEIVMRGLSMPHSPRWYDGRWNPAREHSAPWILRTERTQRSWNCQGSRVVFLFAVHWRSLDCRRCVRPRCSAAFRSQKRRWKNELAGCGL
jgi:uncharacterized protein (TIGR03032 family)